MRVLIIEDGDEYRMNLTAYVAGPEYLQAHDAAQAVTILEQQPVDLIYLDMRFDRIDRERLVGDHESATDECNGDPEAGWRYLQNNQGLYILHHLHERGLAERPVILAYDFAREPARWDHLQKQFSQLRWVSDAITGDEIRRLMEALVST